jgi:hypothetical protein
MRSAVGNIPSATRVLYHVVLARELLKVPPSVEGDVIECGAYKGASSASLSLACELVGRKLWVCDSFAGLPVAEADIIRDYPHLKVYGQYRQGMYSGALAEVQENVRKYLRSSGASSCPACSPNRCAASPRISCWRSSTWI